MVVWRRWIFPILMVVIFGRQRVPDPFTTTALLAAGAIANTVTNAIAGSSNFSRFTGPLLGRRYRRPYGQEHLSVRTL